jgi:hypothetical protein
MSNFQHTFTVRQHTPMIHFQADQDGAFLRVSELKPAFDRFLWEKVWTPQEDIESKVEMLICFTPNQKQEIIDLVKIKGYQWDDWSLDYSIDIESVDNNKRKKDSINKFPCYFADLGNSANKPQFVFYEPNFEIEFTCFNKDLLEIIVKYFPIFMSKTNFGTRKSKGFGSFTVLDSSTSLPIVPSLKTKGLYSFEVNNQGDTTHRTLFEYIDLFWKVVRNGIDIPLNIPSSFGKWTESEGLNFDKKQLKIFVDLSLKKDSSIKEKELLNSIDGSILYRDLLGLASTTDWLSQKIKLEKISNDTDESIERFASPILIKPVKKIFKNQPSTYYTVYVFFPLLNSEILNKEFNIKFSKNREDFQTTFKTFNGKKSVLREFAEYLSTEYKDYFLDEFESNNRSSDVKKLKTIFRSFKKVTES